MYYLFPYKRAYKAYVPLCDDMVLQCFAHSIVTSTFSTVLSLLSFTLTPEWSGLGAENTWLGLELIYMARFRCDKIHALGQKNIHD